MTCVAVGRQTGINVILVAIGTRHYYMAPRKREWRIAVIESRGLPRRKRMACRTVGRESRVGGRIRRVEIVLMATYTRSGSPGVLPILVALSAGHGNMRACQRKYRLAVIER